MQGFNADSTSRRELPESIVIPPIRGEMARLRPAAIEDLAKMDALHAFDGAAVITGKDSQSERAMVHAWVNRSVQWSSAGSTEEKSNQNAAAGDAQSRPTIAWSIVPDFIDDAKNTNDDIIGMIFLIDIDGWSKSARIQVILGRDYRGRGYSRDAMPRVMTYGFAPSEVGLALHRIWVGVPAANARSLSVYQSLGFMKTGTARDALWDSQNQKYQDFVVMDTLVDEYDAIRSLDAFGLHVIEDNPGVCEALSAHEHSIAIPVKNGDSNKSLGYEPAESNVKQAEDTSKRAWWRIIGRGRKRNQASEESTATDAKNATTEGNL